MVNDYMLELTTMEYGIYITTIIFIINIIGAVKLKKLKKKLCDIKSHLLFRLEEK